MNTTRPALSGTAKDGQTIQTDNGTWTGTTPMTYTYQWGRCDSTGNNCAPLTGATNPTYTLTPGDVGNKLYAQVTATNTAGTTTAKSYLSATVIAACAGVSVSPGTNLQKVVDDNPQGTTFCLQTGTYHLTQAVSTRSYDTFVGRSGVVFDGQGKVAKGLWGYGGTGGQTNVTVKNIVFQNFTGPAVALGWYATVTGNEMRLNQVGVTLNSYSTLDGNYIHDNYQYGVTGGPGNDMLIENNEIAHNNTSQWCGGGCSGDAGGSKIIGSTGGTYGLTWQGNYVHDNFGNGIWSDGNVHDVVYENNSVVDNTGSGILHEISWDAQILDNTLVDNDSSGIGTNCWDGQITVYDSTNVEVSGNTAIAANGANGVCAADIARTDGAPYSQAVANLDVHDNTVKMLAGAVSGLVGRSSAAQPSAKNSFRANSYYLTNPTGTAWTWSGSANTLAWPKWQAAGQDATGTVASWTGS